MNSSQMLGASGDAVCTDNIDDVDEVMTELEPMCQNRSSYAEPPCRSTSLAADQSPNGKPTSSRRTDDGGSTNERTRLGDIVNNFAGDTSLLGVPRVILASNRLTRLFWIVVCVTCAVMFIEGVAELFKRYFEYPKQVTVEMKSEPVSFPAVTLCNYRSLDFHIINRISQRINRQPSGDLYDTELNPNLDYFYQSSDTGSESDQFMDEYWNYVAKLYLILESDRFHTDPEVRLAAQVAATRLALYTSMNESVYFAAGIPLEQYVASCSLGGFPCNITRDFNPIYHPSYFKCYTYTHSGSSAAASDEQAMSDDPDKKEPWLMAGLDNGLSVVVLTGSGMVDQSKGKAEALPGLYDAGSATAGNDGVRVIVHPPNVGPIPLAEGFDVPPGFTASFSVRPRRNLRIGPPHGDCINVNPLVPDEFSSAGAYRQLLCQQMCLQRQILDVCQCYDESLPMFYANIPTCRSLKHFPQECSHYIDEVEPCLEALMVLYERFKCARQVREGVRENRAAMTDCECRAPCNELLYDVAYSLARWPANGYESDATYDDIFHVHHFLDHFGDSDEIRRHFNESGDRSTALKDFARINVYVADPEVLVTKESPEYEPSQLVSDIGGQLGVWIGVSLITVAEVFEFLYVILYRTISPRCRRDRDHSQHSLADRASTDA